MRGLISLQCDGTYSLPAPGMLILVCYGPDTAIAIQGGTKHALRQVEESHTAGLESFITVAQGMKAPHSKMNRLRIAGFSKSKAFLMRGSPRDRPRPIARGPAV